MYMEEERGKRTVAAAFPALVAVDEEAAAVFLPREAALAAPMLAATVVAAPPHAHSICSHNMLTSSTLEHPQDLENI